jgi:hypothetical protein
MEQLQQAADQVAAVLVGRVVVHKKIQLMDVLEDQVHLVKVIQAAVTTTLAEKIHIAPLVVAVVLAVLVRMELPTQEDLAEQVRQT